MVNSPIRWALGVMGSVLLGVGYYAPGLVASSGVESRPQAAALTTGAGKPAVAPARQVENPTLTVAANYGGHYIVHPMVDNLRVQMMVDTGASIVALTATDARALGIKPNPGDYRMSLGTANGIVRGARVTLREVRLGDILVRNVDAVVLPEGALGMSLLGTSFLGKLRGYEVKTGRMVLRG